MGIVASQFGTWRGAIRLALAHGEVVLQKTHELHLNPATVTRLVFVCQGNICRSAFADVAARANGLNAASFGLSTDSGKPAHSPAIMAAAVLGIDLGNHRTTRAEDFNTQPGDLLLAMETRQLRRLAADPRLGQVPRVLLGRYIRPAVPHLHDPFGLSDAYMLTCLSRIAASIPRLRNAFPGARIS